MKPFLKPFIAPLLIVAIALIVRVGWSGRVGLDIHVHDTYHVISIRLVAFWFLIAIAVTWFLFAAYKSARLSR